MRLSLGKMNHMKVVRKADFGLYLDGGPTGDVLLPNRGCYVTATRISDGSQVDGVEVTMQMAQSEGWTSNSKWRNMPELMLAYRASAFFARVYCPEAMMGVQTAEEVYDADSTPINAATSLTAALKGETEE